MVNRGWVPQSWFGNFDALARTSSETTTVVGVVQPSEKPSAVVPDNVPDQQEFHWFDVPTLVSLRPGDCRLLQGPEWLLKRLLGMG